MKDRNYYEVLEISDPSDVGEMHAAYKRLANQFQRSKLNAFDYVIRMRELNRAYLTLSNPDNRAEYDENIDDIDEDVSFVVSVNGEVISSGNLNDNEEEDDDDEVELEIPVEFDRESANQCKVKYQSCTVYFVEKGELNVIGEIVSSTGKAIAEYLKVRFNIYNADGKLIGTDFTYPNGPRTRKSFSENIYFKPKSAIPAKITMFFEI